MKPRLFPLLTLLLGLAVAGSAWAQQGLRPSPLRMGGADASRSEPRPDRMESRAASRPAFPRAARDESSSLSDSVRWAQRSYGGRVLGAERVQSGGREITRIKLMDDEGRVRYVDADRQSRRQSAPEMRTRGGEPTTP